MHRVHQSRLLILPHMLAKYIMYIEIVLENIFTNLVNNIQLGFVQ